MSVKLGRARVAMAAAAGALALVAPATSWAQGSSPRTITVPFAGATSEDGYVTASMSVTYAFITCQGEMHIAYSLNEGSATAGPSYRLGGKTYPASGAPPQPISITFAGTVYRGPSAVGSFADTLAGKALGMGCFTGQTQKIANIADVVGPNATPARIVAYYNSLHVQPRPGNVLRSAAQESLIRGELRRAEAEAAAAKRKAEQEQQARADAVKAREAKAQAEHAKAPVAAPTPPVASNGGAAAPSQVAVARAPNEAERIARAIESDRLLADQRRVQQEAQKRAFDQQMAANEAERQRQSQAVVAAAPAIASLGGALYDMEAQWRANRYRDAQLRLAGKCTLPNGMSAPKDGEIRLGVEITAPLNSSDCGDNPSNRYKAYKLELKEPARLNFRIRPAGIFGASYGIIVRDYDKRVFMSFGGSDWGMIQRTFNKTANLPAGSYVVTVVNGLEDNFADFKLLVEAVGRDGRAVAVAPAAPAQVRAATVTTRAPVDPPVSSVAAPPGRGPYLGLVVAPGPRAVITGIAAGSPAEAAGLQPGDEIILITGANSGFFGAVQKVRDQAELDRWLATQKADAKQTLSILRGGSESMNVVVTPGPPPARAAL